MNQLRSTTDGFAAALGKDAISAIDAAQAKLTSEMAPVPDGEAGANWTLAIDERLRRLAVKVAPHLPDDRCRDWRQAMVEALSDLPAMISLTATKRARHLPFRYMGDIETGVREIASGMIEDRRRQFARLEQIREGILRASTPPPSLPAPGEIPFTIAEIRAMSREVRSMGLKCGALTEYEIAAADAAHEHNGDTDV